MFLSPLIGLLLSLRHFSTSTNLPAIPAFCLIVFLFEKIVNEVPRSLRYEKNDRPSTIKDIITIKAIFERWPRKTWFSPKERVLFQAHRLRSAVARSNDKMIVVASQKELRDAVQNEPSKVSALIAVEGLTSLEGDIANVDRFYNEGIRILYVLLGPLSSSFRTSRWQSSFSHRTDQVLFEISQRPYAFSWHGGMCMTISDLFCR